MLKGEDARVVAKALLREKSPESESFNRRLSYPNVVARNTNREN